MRFNESGQEHRISKSSITTNVVTEVTAHLVELPRSYHDTIANNQRIANRL
jgi:hypothetical protein